MVVETILKGIRIKTTPEAVMNASGVDMQILLDNDEIVLP